MTPSQSVACYSVMIFSCWFNQCSQSNFYECCNWQNSISTENSSNFWVDQPQKLSIKTKEMSSYGPIGKSENNPEQDCWNYYTSSNCCQKTACRDCQVYISFSKKNITSSDIYDGMTGYFIAMSDTTMSEFIKWTLFFLFDFNFDLYGM